MQQLPHLGPAGHHATAAWSASSPTATCASRSASTAPVAEVMTKENLVTAQPGITPRGGEGDPARATASRSCSSSTSSNRAARPDHGEGHREDDPTTRTPCKDELGRLRVGARDRHRPRPRGARRGAGARRRRRARGRHRARPLAATSSRPSRDIKARAIRDVDVVAGNVATAEGARALVEGRRRRHQGRHGAGVDLHDARRLRRRRAAADRRRRRRRAAASAPTSRSSPTAASSSPATSPRRSPPARTRS